MADENACSIQSHNEQENASAAKPKTACDRPDPKDKEAYEAWLKKAAFPDMSNKRA